MDAISNNVIKFPKNNIHVLDPLKESEEISKKISIMRHYHIQETIGSIAPLLFNHLEVSGFEVSDEDPESLKEGAFVIEALRSIMCKYYGIYHPFQQIAQNVFIPDKEEEGALRIVDSLNIALEKTETAI